MRKILLILFPAFLWVITFAQPLAYKNTSLSFEERAADLVSRMTLDEKISQMVNEAPAIPHLGIPAYNWWNEGLHGVARAGYATVFPQAIGMAAMWDDSMHFRIATAISDEFRAIYHDALRNNTYTQYKGLTVWSPNINIFRDPRWGRGQETYGEDPCLTSRYGVAFTKGLQGNHPKYFKTIATPKHYAVHSGPEKLRHEFDVDVSERDLLETYLPAFEACVREGKAYSIMGAYNRFRGHSCSASDTLLNQIARNQWGFEGFVVSDCGAIDDIYATHKIVTTPEEAAAYGVKYGCDLNCGDTYLHLKKAIEKGYIAEKEIDVAITRLMLARMKLGMFDPDEMVPYAKIPIEVNNSAANNALALQAAQKSLVLLKNNGVLPLNRRTIKKIAILGPNANDVEVLYGNYNGFATQPVTVLEGMKKSLLPKNKVYFNPLNPLTAGMFGNLLAIGGKNLEADGKQGLKAEYFSNVNFEGTPVIATDTIVDFDWSTAGPAPLSKKYNYSVRWTGKLVIPETGEYNIGFEGDDGFRIYIDGKIHVESWKRQATTTIVKKIKFNKGAKPDIKVEYYQGEGGAYARLVWEPVKPDAEAEVMNELKDCDVIIYCGGLSPRLEGEEMPVPYAGFDGGDRSSIDLPKVQLDMLKKLKKTGKPVVFVVMSGSPLALNWEDKNLDAILWAWYPGQQGGTAIASAIFGDYNPGGRLPLTFYKSDKQLPPFENYDMAGRTYRYFSGEPLYPFGYGLSYTKFKYSELSIPSTSKTDATVKVKFTVLNSGGREGDEVVQLYVRRPNAPAPIPLYSLKGFKRISLKGGERKTLEFELSLKDIAVLDKNNKWVVIPGDLDIFVGSQKPDDKLVQDKTMLFNTVVLTGNDYFLK